MKQANLVTVNDANEQNFLAGIFGKRGSWCGLNNKDNMNVFQWVSGEKSDFTYWGPNQPRSNKKKRCVHMQWENGYNHRWIVLGCAKSHRFTCEKGRFTIYNE